MTRLVGDVASPGEIQRRQAIFSQAMGAWQSVMSCIANNKPDTASSFT